MKRILIILLCTSLVFSAFKMADVPGLIDSLKTRLAIYQGERPFINLYVHLDKNNYLTNESIWFKAYILSPLLSADTGNMVLFVRLTDKNKRIVLNYRFPVYDIRAHGDILLPDTLKEGEYYFYAFTNRMVNYSPNQVFVQKINVFKNAATTMEAEAGVTDSSKLRRGQAVDILIKLKKGLQYVTDVKGSYQLLVDNKPIRAGKISTNFLGEAFISFTYPQIADDKTVKVTARFAKDNDVAELNLNLRHEASPVVVRAYPEGGHLVDGIDNNMAIEAGDNQNNPVVTQLLFKNNNKVITRLQTNGYGIAKLSFTPQPGGHYTFEVPGNPNKKPIELDVKPEPAGFGLRIKKTGNQYYAVIINKSKSDSATLVLRSYYQLLWDQHLALKAGDSTQIALPVNTMAKEVLSLAIFDNQGDCAAERLFMNKTADDYNIGIKTEQQVYGARTKVKVTINVTGADGAPVRTNLSVAAVEKTRISSSYNTILDGYYNKGLSTSFPDQHYNRANAEEMDAVLMTKKWWLNNWDAIDTYKQRGFIRIINHVGGLSGTIERRNHKALDIKQVILYSKSTGFTAIPINADGSFSIGTELLTSDRSDDKYLMLNDGFYDKYSITFAKIDEEYDALVKVSEAMKFLEPYNTMVKLNDKTGINLKGAIALKEVKINTRGTTTAVELAVFNSPNCNDWVCLYNILNCPNHSFGSRPVNGAVYSYRGHPVIYHGCGDFNPSTHFLLKNICLPNDFILPDYDKNPSNEPELRSTVYWNPNLNTDKTGKATFEFFTSDIKGDFTIMAQGIDIHTLKPVFGTGSFSVH